MKQIEIEFVNIEFKCQLLFYYKLSQDRGET